MTNWIIFSCLIVLTCANPGNEDDECPAGYCEGEGYECISGRCYCTDGYVPNYYQTRCVKCPGIGERCFGICCNPVGNTTLQCWQGVCQPCHDATGKWICRFGLNYNACGDNKTIWRMHQDNGPNYFLCTFMGVNGKGFMIRIRKIK